MGVQTLMQLRRGSAATWTSVNPTLSAGEQGYETDTGKYKIGDGITSWTSLAYAAIIPGAFVGASGIGVLQGTNGNNLTVSVTGITSSQVNDFNTAVDARVSLGAVSPSQVMDIVGTGIVAGTGIVLKYDTNAYDGQLTVNTSGLAYSGHTHTASAITDFNSSVSGLLPITSVAAGTGVNITSAGTTYTVNVTGIPLTFVRDVTATATQVNYLNGTTLGTVVSSKVVAVDSNSDITGFRDVSLTRNLTVGGNLTVNGTTTTVNSTTVDIGDNIIQVNVSGASTQGGIQVLDHDNSETHKFVWDIDNSRWEFSGPTSPDIYTSGNLTSRTLTSTVANGTAPLQVTSTTAVTNLNADLLDGQHGSYYLDWTNTTNKPDPIITGTLTGNVTGSASVTLTDLANGVLSIGTTIASGVVTSDMIADGSIMNVDINASAAIAVSKFAAGSSGQILQTNNSGTVVWGSIDGGTP